LTHEIFQRKSFSKVFGKIESFWPSKILKRWRAMFHGDYLFKPAFHSIISAPSTKKFDRKITFQTHLLLKKIVPHLYSLAVENFQLCLTFHRYRLRKNSELRAFVGRWSSCRKRQGPTAEDGKSFVGVLTFKNFPD
jgi:hypothetical protein